MKTQTRPRKRYRYKSREAAEAEALRLERRSLQLLWLYHSTVNGSLKTIAQHGDYTLTWFETPNSHFEIYCLAFSPAGNGVALLDFFESHTECNRRLADSLQHMSSNSPDWETFNTLERELNRFGG